MGRITKKNKCTCSAETNIFDLQLAESMGDPEQDPSTWLQIGSAPATVAIWGVKTGMKTALCL